MKAARAITALAVAAPLAAGATHLPLVEVDLSLPAGTLLERAEALGPDQIARILHDALASIGCALPADLVGVFEVYLIDHVMAHIGQPIGPDLAQQAFFSQRSRSVTINHPDAGAILAAARAVDGQVAVVMGSGTLTLRQGMFDVPDCEATGTVFALAPYAPN